MAVGAAGPLVAGPAARRLARALGVDLSHVAGSGRRGRLTPADVRHAAASANPVAAEPPITARADLSRLLERLPAIARAAGRTQVSLAPLLVKAAAVALRAAPGLAPLRLVHAGRTWSLPTDGPPAAGDALRRGAAVRLEGPVTEVVYDAGAVRARSYLEVTLQRAGGGAAEPFVRALVELLETPYVLLAA